jgi:hypothetical protein
MRGGHDGIKGLIARHNKSRWVKSRQCNIRRQSGFHDNLATSGAELPSSHPVICSGNANLHTPLQQLI